MLLAEATTFGRAHMPWTAFDEVRREGSSPMRLGKVIAFSTPWANREYFLDRFTRVDEQAFPREYAATWVEGSSPKGGANSNGESDAMGRRESDAERKSP